MASKQILVRTPESLLERINDRMDWREPNEAATLRGILADYFLIYDDERKRLREILTPGEVAAVVDVLNSNLLDAGTYRYLWVSVDDAMPDGLAEKWEIDGAQLVAKLRSLTLAQTIALYWAVRRFWNRVGAEVEGLDPRTALED